MPPSPSWLPGRGRTNEETITSDTISTHSETSNTRSSFGRGMNWMPTTETTTGSIWKVTGRYQTETPWYPSRPGKQMMIDNDIDEPNQQGLGSRNSAFSIYYKSSFLLTTFVTVLFLFGR